MLANFSCFCYLSSADFKNYLLKKNLSRTLSECHILSVLIWVQNDCKGYQQTTKGATSKEKVTRNVTQHVFLNHIFSPFMTNVVSCCTLVLNIANNLDPDHTAHKV